MLLPQQMAFVAEGLETENPDFLQDQLITYIGNKRSLLPFIGKGVEHVKRRLNKNRLVCLDLFSGTGVVSRYLKQHAEYIVANDLELYSKITNSCYLSNAEDIDHRALREALSWLRSELSLELSAGFIAELYSPKDDNLILPGERAFYTRRNAEYLDTARQKIDLLPEELRLFFLAPLIAKASVHANTSGVFKGFYKSKDGIGQFGGHGQDALSRITRNIEICAPTFSSFSCAFSVHQEDANSFISNVETTFDIAYLDPPYNQHPYGSNYFMLNLLADYRKPAEISDVSGIPTDWNRSKYNKKPSAEDALLEVVSKCNAKFVLISYNSEGFITQECFVRRLAEIGKVTMLETAYNTFRGSRNLSNRSIHVTEFLYLVEKN